MPRPFTAVLEREYQERRRKTPRFSLRDFARQLGVNVSTLSRLLREQRAASPELIRRVAERMKFGAPMIEQLLAAEAGVREDPRAYERELQTQSREEIEAMAGWEYLAIQALLETDLVFTDVPAIAERLALTPARVRACLETLVKYQMIVRHQGRWKSTYKRVIAYRRGNPPVRAILDAFLELARRRLADEARPDFAEVPQAFSGMVMPVDPAKLPEAERRIREFRNDLAAFLGTGRKTEVYRIGIQLFTLTPQKK